MFFTCSLRLAFLRAVISNSNEVITQFIFLLWIPGFVLYLRKLWLTQNYKDFFIFHKFYNFSSHFEICDPFLCMR